MRLSACCGVCELPHTVFDFVAVVSSSYGFGELRCVGVAEFKPNLRSYLYFQHVLVRNKFNYKHSEQHIQCSIYEKTSLISVKNRFN